jgi:hypothetical protein
MAQLENFEATDVFDQLELDIDSRYNIAKYMRTTLVWDRLAKQIRELSVWRGVALQVPARLDIASFIAYEDSRLDWILILYNNYKNTDELLAGTVVNCPLKEEIDIILDSVTAEETVTGRIGFSRL